MAGIWNQTTIKLVNSQIVHAIEPVIISASRSTDIPAFFANQFLEQFKTGYTVWKNPFNQKLQYISFIKTRLVVFWSKFPQNIFETIDYFDATGINYYFQFTLNNYDDQRFEPNLPSLEKRIDLFIKLSKRIGKEKIIWRFDPLILTQELSPQKLIEKIEQVAEKIYLFTNKLVFSFIDINAYKKIATSPKIIAANCREFSIFEANEFAQLLIEKNRNWNLQLATCAEEFDLSKYGIEHNKCIDDQLIIKLFKDDIELMQFTEKISQTKRGLKDLGQRGPCNCIVSKDIGAYNTCNFGCIYCYANRH